MVRPDRGVLVQEADLRYGGNNLIVSETALTSQGSKTKGRLYVPTFTHYVYLVPVYLQWVSRRLNERIMTLQYRLNLLSPKLLAAQCRLSR